MRKWMNNRWVVAALATAAIIFVWLSLTQKPSVPRAAFESPAEQAAPPETLSAEPEQGQVTIQEALKQLGRITTPRDPFATRLSGESPTSAEKKPDTPDVLDTVRLSAIWTQGGATLVLINARIFAPGDTIGRLQIESASADGVWFTHWQGRTFLAPGETFILKTPARLAGTPSSP